MRVFLALDVPEEIKNIIEEKQRELREEIEQGAWVKKDSLHATLVFMGDREEAEIEKIKGFLERETKEWQTCREKIKKADIFPNLARPEIVQLSLRTNTYLGEIVGIIKDFLEKERIYFAGKMPFLAHITLGRIGRINKVERRFLRNWLKEIHFSEEIVFRKIILYKSQLTSEGSVYTKLANWSLKEK